MNVSHPGLYDQHYMFFANFRYFDFRIFHSCILRTPLHSWASKLYVYSKSVEYFTTLFGRVEPLYNLYLIQYFKSWTLTHFQREKHCTTIFVNFVRMFCLFQLSSRVKFYQWLFKQKQLNSDWLIMQNLVRSLISFEVSPVIIFNTGSMLCCLATGLLGNKRVDPSLTSWR